MRGKVRVNMIKIHVNWCTVTTDKVLNLPILLVLIVINVGLCSVSVSGIFVATRVVVYCECVSK